MRKEQKTKANETENREERGASKNDRREGVAADGCSTAARVPALHFHRRHRRPAHSRRKGPRRPPVGSIRCGVGGGRHLQHGLVELVPVRRSRSRVGLRLEHLREGHALLLMPGRRRGSGRRA